MILDEISIPLFLPTQVFRFQFNTTRFPHYQYTQNKISPY